MEVKNNKKNVIVWSWSKDASISPVEYFFKKDLLNVVFWITREGKKTYRTKRFSYMPELMLKEVILFGKVNQFYNKSIANLNMDLNRFIGIYSRFNCSKGLESFDLINLFHLYYTYFYNLCISKKVDILIFFGPPNGGADYILYLVAKSLNLEVVITIQSLIPNRFFCINSIEDFGLFNNNLNLPTPKETEVFKIDPEFKKDYFYMKKKEYKRGFLIDKLIRDIYRSIFPTREPIAFAGVIQKQVARFNYKKQYKIHALSEKSIDFSKKFVYFPLQLQPEITTSFFGGDFSDQILAIEKLAELLPEDWFIYVKENPKQGFQQRNKYFYNRLSRIKNCLYLKDDIDTYKLITLSQFVSTVTGTAAWESISGGKPALVFGYNWYTKLPGIVRYKEGIKLEDILAVKFSHSELESSYTQLINQHTYEGIIEDGYEAIHLNYSKEKNTNFLIKFLSNFI